MSFKKDLVLLLKPYYWMNILLSLSYLIVKRTEFLCSYFFKLEDCELDGRETEILFFLVIVVMIRTRKAGSVTMINYLTASFIYAKVANLILWFYADPRLGLAFFVVFILVGLLLPEPTYSGPEKIIYFRGLQNMEEEFQRDKKVTWLVCFYTAWHPACVTFAPIFAQISANYYLDNLRFGKIDVGRFPDAAAKYRIMDGALSRQLPTLILFQEGVENVRRPQPDTQNKLLRFLFSEDNVKAAFDLVDLHKENRQKLSEKPSAAKAKRD